MPLIVCRSPHRRPRAPTFQELPNLSEARDSKVACKHTIPPASYKFRLYSGKVLELFANDLYKLDGKMCTGPFTGDDFCDVSAGCRKHGCPKRYSEREPASLTPKM